QAALVITRDVGASQRQDVGLSQYGGARGGKEPRGQAEIEMVDVVVVRPRQANELDEPKDDIAQGAEQTAFMVAAAPAHDPANRHLIDGLDGRLGRAGGWPQ